jgi:glycosyltransferase involved in cell wall biosynthesis
VSGRRRIAVYGAEPHRWQSVDRTRRFYLDALGAAFDLVALGDAEPPPAGVGAVLSYSGSGGWRHLAPRSVPHLFAVHGGATLDHEALRQSASRLRSTDTLIVNCTSDETILASLFDGDSPRFCRLPLPANDACWADVSREEARAALPFRGPPDLVVGFVARLLPQKNLHLFLRMFAELRARLAPRRLDAVVVGEYWADYPVLPYMTRDYREYVASLARSLGVGDAIVYLGGGLPDGDLRLVYGALDVLIHPTWSIDENFGYVPVEAMA